MGICNLERYNSIHSYASLGPTGLISEKIFSDCSFNLCVHVCMCGCVNIYISVCIHTHTNTYEYLTFSYFILESENDKSEIRNFQRHRSVLSEKIKCCAVTDINLADERNDP